MFRPPPQIPAVLLVTAGAALAQDVSTRVPDTPLIHIAQGGKVALLTIEMENPHGYGRIIREGGKVRRIVEEKDASPEQRRVTEVNTGIMVLPNQFLPGLLAALKNSNAQGEYYLTDVIDLAVSAGIEVATAHPAHPREVLGVNSKIQLAQLERMYQQAQAHRLLDSGVTLLDPERIDIRGSLSCGRDVVIDVNCVFEGQVSLGDGVKVGANCVLREHALIVRSQPSLCRTVPESP